MKESLFLLVLRSLAKREGYYGRILENADCIPFQLEHVKTVDDVREYCEINNYWLHSNFNVHGVKTRYGWYNDGRGFDDYCKPGDKISERLYNYFLEILPPKYMAGGFMVSEPYSYCPDFKTNTYAGFYWSGAHYYYLGNISPRAWDAAIEFIIKE